MERLIIFGKRPRLGRVKTRLCPPLDAPGGLELYRAFVADTLALARALSRGRTLELCSDGPWDQASIPSLDPCGFQLTEQGPGDLGQRLLRAFRRSHAAGSASTVILGTDSPTLPARQVQQAFERLAGGARAVIAPAVDGGYVLIGSRQPAAALFQEIPWGGPTVAATTEERAQAIGLRLELLPGWYDVDDRHGLSRLSRDLADPEIACRAPHSAETLARVLPGPIFNPGDSRDPG